MNISVPDSLFDTEKLKLLASEHSAAYQTAEPFSHIYFDNFLPEEYLDRVLAEFPDVQDSVWYEFKSEADKGKLGSTKYELIPPYTRWILNQFNTPPFLEFLEKLTGIEKLIPDPYFLGGGMHQTKPDGRLGIHVDFNKLEELGLFRRINILLYLNKDYKDEYGGHLELWGEKMEKCYDKIAPAFNRLAIFTTSENSHHGHPDPLLFPSGTTRKSLAWYYYTAENGETISTKQHTTIFKARPGKDSSFTKMKARALVRSLIPDMFIPALKRIRGVFKK
jgi:hypothetical protein